MMTAAEYKRKSAELREYIRTLAILEEGFTPDEASRIFCEAAKNGTTCGILEGTDDGLTGRLAVFLQELIEILQAEVDCAGKVQS
jgi:hypothetical protein